MTFSREKKDIDKNWLTQRYVEEGADVRDLASEVGCSVHTIKKWLKVWQIKRGEKTQRKAWNKGLSKAIDPRLKKLSEDRMGDKNPMAGRDPWNLGLTAENNEIMAQVRAKNIGRVVSDETREKQRLAKLGKRGEEACNYKFGKHLVGKVGCQYWVVGDGEIKRYEHRIIAEKSLGRELEKTEHVHHLNGDKLDNNPENLIILNSGTHQRLHRYCFPATKQEQLDWLSSQNEWFFEVKCED